MRLALAVAIIFSVLIVDISSKWFIEAYVMVPPRVIPILPSFNFVLGHNRGVSFGLFNSENPYAPYVLSALALVIIIVLSIALRRSRSFIHTAGYSAVIGGALGNVIDRLQDGAVTDFLDFYVAQYHWPAFNVADSVIITGLICILIPLPTATGIKRK